MPVTVAPPQDLELDEAERVLLWRISTLVGAGYCDECAIEIACSAIDLHAAVDLLERGCPTDLALRILF
jgi:hypothetical protein